MTHPYLQKCLELSERATKGPWRYYCQQPELSVLGPTKPVAVLSFCLGQPDGSAGSNAELIAFSRTALPKVCEALKECLIFLNAMKAYGDTRAEDLLSRLNSLFDDADGGA